MRRQRSRRAYDLAGHCSAAADCAIHAAGIGRRSCRVTKCARNLGRAGLIGAANISTLCGCKCAGAATERAHDLARHFGAAAELAIHFARIG